MTIRADSYRGLCVSGPMDGRMYESRYAEVMVPLHKPGMCMPVPFLYHFVRVSLADGSVGFWLPKDVTCADAIEHLQTSYSAGAKRRQRRRI